MAKSPQQRYLEKVIEVVKCRCGCGKDVVRRRVHYFPSQLKKNGLPEYAAGHHPNSHRALARNGAAQAKRLKGKFGPDTPHWKGGRVKHGKYMCVRVDDKYIFEHRHVMEQHLGRMLRVDEHVHHKNGDTKDNRSENLELLTASEHGKRHDEERPRNAAGQYIG